MERTNLASEQLTTDAYERLLAISVQLNATRDLSDLLPYIIETDAEVLSIMAAHAAIAVRNARQMQLVQQAYDQLQQVVMNIVKNAVQFTPAEGTITLRARLQDGEVLIVVQDTGIGLPETALDRIFDEFYQVEEYLTRTHEGLGLGLTITRKLVELHGGRVWATSDGPDQGTALHVAPPALAD